MYPKNASVYIYIFLFYIEKYEQKHKLTIIYYNHDELAIIQWVSVSIAIRSRLQDAQGLCPGAGRARRQARHRLGQARLATQGLLDAWETDF